jgi:hypothetical protein
MFFLPAFADFNAFADREMLATPAAFVEEDPITLPLNVNVTFHQRQHYHLNP